MPHLRFEVGDPVVRGGQFAGAILHFALEEGEPVCGLPERLHLLAELVNLAGPAGLVMLLAVFGEAGALESGRELGVQVGVTGGRAGRRGGRRGRPGCSGLVEEAVDAAHAAARAVAAFKFLAQAGAGEHGVLASQLVDQLEDRGVRQAGRAGHGSQDSGIRKITEIPCRRGSGWLPEEADFGT